MRRIAALSLALSLLLAGHARADESTDPRLAESRQMTQAFMVELKTTLMQSMQQSGPVDAIRACRNLAPAIAIRLSETHRASVGRTSLKLRNPANSPDDWQRAVLISFENRRKAGETPNEIEHFEVMPDGSARYMKAIATQPPCLTCHGNDLSDNIKSALELHYPDDQATGFRIGDIRGAYHIDWPTIMAQEP